VGKNDREKKKKGKKTNRLRHITPLKPPHLLTTHPRLLHPVPLLHAQIPVHLLVGAVLECRPANHSLALLVALENIHHLLMVALVLGIDDGLGSIVLPEVGIAAILEETFAGYGRGIRIMC